MPQVVILDTYKVDLLETQYAYSGIFQSKSLTTLHSARNSNIFSVLR